MLLAKVKDGGLVLDYRRYRALNSKTWEMEFFAQRRDKAKTALNMTTLSVPNKGLGSTGILNEISQGMVIL